MLNIKHLKTRHIAHTACLCVLYGSENKQRLFPYTTVAVVRLWRRQRVLCAAETYCFCCLD